MQSCVVEFSITLLGDPFSAFQNRIVAKLCIRLLTLLVTFIQLVMSVGRIDIGQISPRPCEYFCVLGCVVTRLGELQFAVQHLISLPSITPGGTMAWRDGERFDMLFNCACTVINKCKFGEK